MKEVTKESELKFLRKLEKHFEKIPQRDINQMKSSICGDETCGCFGAHIAKLYNLSELETSKKYFYGLGLRKFRDNTNKETESLFLKHGAERGYNCEMLDGCNNKDIFSAFGWSKHPYEVIKKVIGELEK